MLNVQIISNVVNMVSRGLLEHHTGYCNYDATWGCLNAIPNRRDFSYHNQFHYILFIL